MSSSTRAPNGVLPMPASQTASSTASNGPRQAAARQSSQKLKLIVRRLAPALTELEFISVIGEEWKVGSGKVDWFRYEPGKDSKDPAKPSKPSRAYLHLSNEAHLHPFSDLVRQSNFDDAQSTFTNSCLIGPPVVEFAPYNRVPAGRSRVDARAGTIDQDAEFMAFLEGLANPVTGKEVGTDSAGEAGTGKPEKVTTTPLVQFLKDKKASKTKEAALKAAKKHESKAKSSASSTSPEDVKKKTKESKPERALERAAKEAVKILNREAAKASSGGPSSAGSSVASSQGNSDTPKLDISKVPIRQRSAATAAHIRMLQRDLGFSPAQAHRQVKRDTADVQKAERAAAVEKAAAAAKDSPSTASQVSSTPTAPKSNAAQPNSRRSRAKGANDTDSIRATSNASSNRATASQNATASQSTPVILLRKPEAAPPVSTSTTSSAAQSVKPTPVILARKPQAAPVPTEGATQAFVKHANPSQGVTEALLKEAMEKFGGVSHVEIDRRKGFAYVDFVDTDGLKKAMAANPIPVGQGTVQVLQRKGTAPVQEKKPINQPPPNNAPPRGPPQNNVPPRGSPQNNGPPRGGRGGGGGRGGTIGRRGGRGGGRGGGNGPANAEASKGPSSAPTGPAAK